ncbi:hypothetical protein [Rhodococcus sp. IEGM 1330]|uniref:hypothetical protein n=1 Tax=Rhodococcus sp. IEGM 1330 TaxID=3082225 RepID=UPI0029536613|nr:hypothetical protein [Rhodococcus sp. IEGM 1330]MDV8024779.1 hypothetical protein [Rhodococcus sp. IEGM 1330]
MTRFAKVYGAPPLHLVAMVLAFALLGYILSVAGLTALWNQQQWWQSIAVWFVGAAVVHDLVLFPLYSLGDRALATGLQALRRNRTGHASTVPILNYLRLPLLGTGLTFLMFFPGITSGGSETYLAATGQTQQPFLHRWLVLVAVMFAVSALVYAVQLARSARSHREKVQP